MNKTLLTLLISFVLFQLNAQNGNACEPTQPRIMVFPSDNMLYQLKCIKEVKSDTLQSYYIRQYDKAFMEQTDLKFVIAGINGKFADRDFPLESLEESLKEISNNSSIDNIRNLQEDALTQLLSSVKPDIIVEVTYKYNKGSLDNSLNFIIEVKDAYSMKVIASIANPGLETMETNVAALIAEQVEKNIPNIQETMMTHFKNIRENGRIIPLRIKLMGDASFTLDDDCGSEEYADVIREVVRTHSNKGTFNAVLAGPSEMKFTNIRIPLCNEKGFAMDARDWVKKVSKDLEKRCGIKAKNATQGLGNAFIILRNK
jgi:Family of unknown function (DUF6175)